VFQSPKSRKIGAVAALAISWCAMYWMFWILPDVPRSILPRLGGAAALLCVVAVFTFFFGVCLAYVGRKQEWSPKTCHLAGILICVPAAALYWAHPSQGLASIIVFQPWFAGHICGKLVHPELTDDEAYAPEPPLTLFPK
jgi:hypothetical protein